MITRVGRLAGAILVESGDQYYLVGNTKQPCDWEESGFIKPREIDARKQPVLLLEATRPVELGYPRLAMTLPEGATLESVPVTVADRFLIERNGSVSDRLWNLILDEHPDTETQCEATWLLTMPTHIWAIVRDTVLRCT